MVYVARTNVDIDDDLIDWVMRRYRLRSKREAVDFALRRLYLEPMTTEEQLAMQGSGWDGDLQAIRGGVAASTREKWAAGGSST